MTPVDAPARSLLDQEADFLRRFQELVATHPAGAGLHVMLATVPVEVPEGSVLVQVVQDGAVRLEPRRLDDLDPSALVHDPIDPTDDLPVRAGAAYATCTHINGRHYYIIQGASRIDRGHDAAETGGPAVA